MSEPNASVAAAAEPAAPAAAPAPAQPVAVPAAEPPKAAPRTLPYARPQRAAAPPPAAAQAPAAQAAAEPSKADGKPANRAAAMQRARADKLAAEVESYRKQVAEVESYRKTLSTYADDAIKGLPKEWQEHLRELSGDDPRKLLELVQKTAHLRAAPAPAAPATSLPSGTPRPAADGDNDVALAQRWRELSKKAPSQAASLLLANRPAIDRGLKKLSA